MRDQRLSGESTCTEERGEKESSLSGALLGLWRRVVNVTVRRPAERCHPFLLACQARAREAALDAAVGDGLDCQGMRLVRLAPFGAVDVRAGVGRGLVAKLGVNLAVQRDRTHQ